MKLKEFIALAMLICVVVELGIIAHDLKNASCKVDVRVTNSVK